VILGNDADRRNLPEILLEEQEEKRKSAGDVSQLKVSLVAYLNWGMSRLSPNVCPPIPRMLMLFR